MTLETVIPLKARTGIAALTFAAMVMPLPAAADSFVRRGPNQMLLPRRLNP